MIVALKAMGIESDQEIIQLIGPEQGFLPLLMPTFQECKQLGLHTQHQALEYIGKPGHIFKHVYDLHCSVWLSRV